MLDTPTLIKGRPGWRIATFIAAVVLALHGLAFDAMTLPAARLPNTATPLQVRVLPETATLPALTGTPPHPAFALAAPMPALPRPARVSRAQVPTALPVALVEKIGERTSEPAGRPAEAPITAVALTPPSPPAEPGAAADVPVYRTRLPPPMMLRFELKRGPLAGIGALLWRPSGQQYELRLDGQVAGLPVLTQASRGAIDAAGIAPDRFTDQRLRRGVQAANFQREKKLVTFSGSSAAYPLVAGAQDRLSWMMQLAGVIAAEPKRAKADGRVSLFVVGTRGEADTWVFDYTATENVATAQGPVRALKFTREPRRPYDSRVEIWLDPARHHVPIHARFTDGETLDLLLIGAEPA